MIRILITGANGFIGRTVVNKLYKNRNYEIFATSLVSKYKYNNEVRFISADLSSESFENEIVKNIKQCDIIVHLGACINYDIFSKEVITANCFGIQQIIKVAMELGCKKIIFSSGTTVIGEPNVLPITEEHPANPRTIYLSSKFFGENLLLSYSKYITPIIFRITSPIGMDMPKNRMLSVFINNILNDKDILIFGKGIRKQNYVDVLDIAEAIDLACKKNVEGIFNIGGEKSYTSIELAEECQRIIGKNVNIKFKDIVLDDEYYDWNISIDKAKKELSYYPRYSLDDSIRNIVKSV